MTKHLLASLCGIVLLAGCAQTLAPPHSINGSVAYAGNTLKAVEDTAAAEYQFMPVAQAKEVHESLLKAETVRDSAVAAAQAGDTATANNKLQTLTTILNQVQVTLQKYSGDANG